MTMQTEYTLLHDPEDAARCDTWLCKIPIIGWQIGGMRQFANERKLVRQAVERGPIPESEWENHQYSRDIRKKLEKIVIDHAFPKNSTFHPLDPFELMMVLRYGDLNEIEIMMAIEDEFGVKMDEELIDWIVKERVTFIEFIRFLEKSAYVSPPLGVFGLVPACPGRRREEGDRCQRSEIRGQQGEKQEADFCKAMDCGPWTMAQSCDLKLPI